MSDEQTEYAEGSRGSLLGFAVIYALTPMAWLGLIAWAIGRAT